MILDPVHFKVLTSPLSEFEGFSKRHLTCAPSDTLEAALDKMLKHHVHRLWITSESGEVRGVLSLRDCISIFVKEPDASPLPRYFTSQASAS
jgi:CBS domain-containing protein